MTLIETRIERRGNDPDCTIYALSRESKKSAWFGTASIGIRKQSARRHLQRRRIMA
jgi:hypothetical protein